MSESFVPGHPLWCLRGPECADGLHFSGLACAAPRGDEVIQVAAGLWQMDVGAVSPGGVLLEFSADDDGSQRWFVDLAQAQALIRLMRMATRSAAHQVPLPRVFGTGGDHRGGKGRP
ncbi:MAG TPA: hypothetical protein VFX61_13585 [Micromonosporaceae bacterium]|nr:hypothetical protein [Micromonosporaceae bacterium]